MRSLRHPQVNAESEISTASRRNATVGQALMPSSKNIGSPRPLSVKVLRIWYASINARMNTTSGTTKYHAQASYEPGVTLDVASWASANRRVERRSRFDDRMPSSTSTKVNHRNSACQ
ncbi:hypothetical protein D3C76_812870 [compost metagenome]